MKHYLGASISAVIFAISTPTLASTTGAGKLEVKLYQMRVAESADCTNPIKVIDNGNQPEYVDLLADPTLGTAAELPDGTYNCLVFVQGDTLRYRPLTTVGAGCTTGADYTFQVPLPDSVNPAGGEFTTGSDRLAVWLSTAETNPTTASGPDTPSALANPLVVSGSTVGIFYLSAANDSVSEVSGSCQINPNRLTIGFRQ